MSVRIRLFGSLCDLTKGRYLFEIDPGVNQTIKDCVERLGVPHTEVSFITLNGEFVDFSRIVRDGETYFVYPETDLPIVDSFLVSPKFRGEPRFVLDIHLGKLAKLLRIFGIYAEYGLLDDGDIVDRGVSTGYIILTKDRKLLMRKDVKYGYVVRNDEPQRQFEEVYRRYKLWLWFKPFTRCLVCNGEIVEVEKRMVEGKVPIRVFESNEKFGVCSSCGKIYWPGTHYERMEVLVSRYIR
ncbi:Mut7-C RNAse domain-containing protein [Fervidobacterium thailandense]|uniref:Twitching motility protein PilT n=1 Tax=Fervidobacterium thailandense TaxID=1008305 RepID=A0A1E3G1E1_9BACT|nr:Mut7-C RNAse domain-containing protein [Fervidobacterium thailandense]ODN30079.1 hypothetical protein A4H02_07180 [Fervidobacterium thailandense]